MNQSSSKVRAHGRNLAMGLAMSGLIALVAQGGCASSDTPEFILLPDAGNSSVHNTGGSSNSGSGGSVGSGGSTSTGGNSATGGNVGSGGNNSSSGGSVGTGGVTTGSGGSGTGGARASGGSTGSGGRATTGSGGTTASGGTTGSGGTTASGGTTGSGGTKASGGTSGSGGSAGSSGSTATFTQVYQQILSVSCTGSQCHSPGSQGGFTFSNQSTAYTAVKAKVVAGNANSSSLYSQVNGGRMPPTGKLSSTLIMLLANWINAGALNN